MKPEIVEANMKLFEEARYDMRRHGMLVSFQCVECGESCSWQDFIDAKCDPREVKCEKCKN